MTRILFVSLPRSGRTYIAKQLTAQGITISSERDGVLNHNADVIMVHDLTLDLIVPGRHVMKILRNPEECLKSWYLHDCRVNKVELDRNKWLARQRELRRYTKRFLDKYRYVHTMYFHDLLNDPNLVLAPIFAILDKPFIRVPVTRHTPENLNIYPFELESTQ